MKLSESVSLVGFVAIIAASTVVVRSCSSEPSISPAAFDKTLEMMRGDMRTATATGGVPLSSDDNQKTQINRISISTSIRADTWTGMVSMEYVHVLLRRGWTILRQSSEGTVLCKGGAQATVWSAHSDSPGTPVTGFLSMAFSPATMME